MFKVVPDQLRVSQGWVRCGQCDEVFDANAHMRNVAQETSPETAPAPLAASLIEVGQRSDQPVTHERVQEQSPSHEANRYDWSGVLESDSADPPSEPLNDAFLEKSPQELAAVSPVNERGEPILETSAPLSFMASKPVERAQGRRGQGVWVAALVLLMGTMIFQVVLLERDRLVAAQPALKPALVAVCEVLRCKVNALRQIESIVIDSSAFSKVQPDVYKLNVTLKNTAAVEVAKPSLELTLTDSQDQALIRKVISPADVGDKGVVIAQADEVSWVIPIAVIHAPGGGQISGYRVLAFYP
jgi:predicted Zn finger-like uncharacterized protein